MEIITHYWPSILEDRGVIDASERKNKLINIQSEIWRKQKPLQRIIVAGTTAVSPAMKVLGIPGRCRIFEIPKQIEYINKNL